MSATGGRKHAEIQVGIWADPHWRTLTPDAQWAYTMVLSQASLTYAGTTAITIRRWSNLAAGMTPERVTAALSELADARFLVLDWDAEEVLVRTFIRNDGLWKQPRMLDAALRAAEKVESHTLRWSICRELRKVADIAPSVIGASRGDKVAETCTAAASSLVRGVEETPAETPSEGLPQGWGAEHGRDHSPYTLHPSPFTSTGGFGNSSSPARDDDRETPQRPVVPVDGWKHVRDLIPDQHPQAVRTGLAQQAGTLLKAGTPEGDVRAALELWLAKPNLGPSVLPSLVSEVIRGRSPTNGKTATAKAMGWLTTGQALMDAYPDEPDPKELTP
jgi:hypothetical protein